MSYIPEATAPLQWQAVLRAALAEAPDAGLVALRRALAQDSPTVIQGETCRPGWDRPEAEVECACPLAYLAWKGKGVRRVGELEQHWARMSWELNQRFRDRHWCAVAVLFAFLDDSPRHAVLAALLAEVDAELHERGVNADAAA